MFLCVIPDSLGNMNGHCYGKRTTALVLSGVGQPGLQALTEWAKMLAVVVWPLDPDRGGAMMLAG